MGSGVGSGVGSESAPESAPEWIGSPGPLRVERCGGRGIWAGVVPAGAAASLFPQAQRPSASTAASSSAVIRLTDAVS